MFCPGERLILGEGRSLVPLREPPERGRCWRTSQHDPVLSGYRDRAAAAATFPLRLCSQNWGNGAVMVSIKKGKKYPSSSVGREIHELGSAAASSLGAGSDISTFLTRELFNPGKPQPQPGESCRKSPVPMERGSWGGARLQRPWQGRINTLDYRIPPGLAHSLSSSQPPCPGRGKIRSFALCCSLSC